MAFRPQNDHSTYRQNRSPKRFASTPPRSPTRYSSTQHRQGNTSGGPSTPNWRNEENRRPPNPIGKNPIINGYTSTCTYCKSINHWVKDCPDRKTDGITYLVNEIVLHQNNDELKSLVSETWNAALLDCGATSTVCGKKWFEEYQKSLPEDEKNKIIMSDSQKPYRFGDGKKFQSEKLAIIPAVIGNKCISINTDIIDANIPLLLSKAAMKKGQMHLNFANDTVNAFGNEIPLTTTSCGLYALPLTKPRQIIANLDHSSCSERIILRAVSDKSEKEIAEKLHRQFAHPTAERLIRLINTAGAQWSHNDKLKEQIKTVTESCQTCRMYKKPPPRPVVGLPMASEFLETVAMDLKMYKGHIILHLIDLCTRLSASTRISNKQAGTIVKNILRIWISVYGSPQNFLSDNGGEFANQEFLKLAEQFGITVKVTAAESPWSNGIVERHNLIISDMLDRILFETNCNIDLALAWATNAKNSLQNISGFSPYQLALGQNPKLPSTCNDDLPAVTNKPASEIIRENLEILHEARKAFIEAENSEKVRRALSSNIRTSGDIKYFSGDTVLYKRAANSGWHGPAKVLGQDGQQVMLKHGSFYVRVHPCRLQLEKNSIQTKAHSEKNRPKEHNHQDIDSDSSDEENGSPEINPHHEGDNSLANENAGINHMNPMPYVETEMHEPIQLTEPTNIDSLTPAQEGSPQSDSTVREEIPIAETEMHEPIQITEPTANDSPGTALKSSLPHDSTALEENSTHSSEITFDDESNTKNAKVY